MSGVVFFYHLHVEYQYECIFICFIHCCILQKIVKFIIHLIYIDSCIVQVQHLYHHEE